MKSKLRQLRNKFINDLIDKFIRKLKINHPFYCGVYKTKLEVIEEFREWWKKQEEI